MSWFIIIAMVGSITVVPMDNKQSCDELSKIVQGIYGNGSGLVGVRCVALSGDPAKGTIKGAK